MDSDTTSQMTQDPPPASDPAPDTPPPRRIRRSSTDRHLGGVSAALAEMLGVTTSTARVLFVVAGLIGGIGVLVYAAMWLLVPDDAGRVVVQGQARDDREAGLAAVAAALATTTVSWWSFDGPGLLVPLLVGIGVWLLARRAPDQLGAGPVGAPPPPPAPAGAPQDQGPPPVPPTPSSPPPSAASPPPSAAPPPAPPRPAPFLGPVTVGLAALTSGVLALLHALDVIDVQPSTVLTAALAVVAGGLLLSTWFGRARGLVWLGLLLLPVVAVSTAADRIDLRGGVGERTVAPDTVTELRDTYRLGAGDLLVDLTGIVTRPGTDLPDITVDQGVGRLRLLVPEEWDVTADVDVQFGELVQLTDDVEVRRIDGSTGVDERLVLAGDEGAPELDVDIEMFAGLVEVHREP